MNESIIEQTTASNPQWKKPEIEEISCSSEVASYSLAELSDEFQI